MRRTSDHRLVRSRAHARKEGKRTDAYHSESLAFSTFDTAARIGSQGRPDHNRVFWILDALFPDYEEVEQLLRVPVVLGLVRQLAEGRGVVRFRTRGELYLQVNEDLMSRAAGKLPLQPDSGIRTIVPTLPRGNARSDASRLMKPS